MKFHLISGLPRSGSTLTSALLRQNPRFYAGISSPVAGLMVGIIANRVAIPGGSHGLNKMRSTCCNNLTRVSIPEEGTCLGGGSFDSFGLTEIFIPSSVRCFGAHYVGMCPVGAFSYCSKIGTIRIEEGTIFDDVNSCNLAHVRMESECPAKLGMPIP